MKEFINGQKFNSWTIIEELTPRYFSGRSYRMVRVRCICGTEKESKFQIIKNGHSKSCGCFNIIQCIRRSTKHNLSYSRIHRIWKGMKERCNNRKSSHFKYYGGRGITYDPRWENFDNFYKDMSEGYDDHLTIDRIDNDGIYCKDNCRWATYSEQQKNKRRRA